MVYIKAVMREQDNNFSAIITGFIDIFLDFLRANTKRPALYHMAGIGDGRIGEMLANNRHTYPATFKIGRALKYPLFPFCIKAVTAQKGIAHFADQLFNTVLAKGKLPMADHCIRFQSLHRCNHIRTLRL